MIKICAWCDKPIEENCCAINYTVSHGICDDCKDQLQNKNKTSLSTFLDYLDIPVFLINYEGRVIKANERAKQCFDKEFSSEDPLLAGEAVECIHSKLPAGCGNTVHCQSCAIRDCIVKTFETREGQINIAATLIYEVRATVKDARILISTEFIENVVYLNIRELV